MDDIKPAEALKEAEEMQGRPAMELPDEYFNPVKNEKVIVLAEQRDGNWKAYGQRFGKVVEMRAVKPEDALGEFLTSG